MNIFHYRRHFIRSLFLPLLFVAFIAAGNSASAASDDAARLVYQLGSRTIAALQTPGLGADQCQARVRGLLAESFDLAFIGRFALGRYWRMATPEQQATYLTLFSEYLVLTYAARLGGYADTTMTVIGSRQAGDKDVVVRSEIAAPGGQTYIADWRLRGSAGAYRIIDVVIEDISLAMTQRSEFAAVVQRHGIEGLLAALRDHTARIQTSAALY